MRRGTSFRGDSRGQTISDYTMGISVFLLAVAFTLALLPSIFVPFNAPIDSGLTTKADRSASYLVSSLSGEEPNTINMTDLEVFFANNQTDAKLRTYLGIGTRNVNVTVTDPADGSLVQSGGVTFRGGDPIPNGPTSAASRIIRVDETMYQVTVRIW